MASNYEAICEENQRRYGTEGAQKSGELAADLYDDRTHFIFELLRSRKVTPVSGILRSSQDRGR